MARPVAYEQQAWKRNGMMKGDGIPAPTGSYEVGCVDLMHRLEGDSDGLLVRLFYPTDPGLAGQHQYAKWLPNPRYMKAYLDFQEVKGSWWKSGLYRMLTDPHMPALYGAPLYMPTSSEPRPSSQRSPSQEEVTGATHKTKDDADDSSPANSSPQCSTNDDATPTEPKPVHEERQATSQTDSDNSTSQAGSGSQTTFPVIVYSHGLGSMRTTSSSVCTDLSSHGYVVASVEHRDQSSCLSHRRVPKPGSDGQFQDDWILFYHRPPTEEEFPLRNRQVLQRSVEVRKSLDLLQLLNEGGEVTNMMGERFDWGQFRGRLQLNTAAVMGHSFGGATTIQALSEDPRFKCGIALDCWMYPVHRDVLEAGLQQPLVFISSWDFQWKENVQSMMKLVTPPNDSGIAKCRIMTIRESNHKNQTDVFFVAPRTFIGDMSRIDPTLCYTTNQDICNAFLKRYLLDDPSSQQFMSVLDGGEEASEHVLFGTNVNLEDNEEVEEEKAGDVEQSNEEGPTAVVVDGNAKSNVVAFAKDRNSLAIASEAVVDDETHSQPEEKHETEQQTGLEGNGGEQQMTGTEEVTTAEQIEETAKQQAFSDDDLTKEEADASLAKTLVETSVAKAVVETSVARAVVETSVERALAATAGDQVKSPTEPAATSE